MPTYAVAIAPALGHSASGSVREIGAVSIILGERQHPVVQVDHEAALMLGQVKAVAELAPAFLKLVEGG